MRSSSIKVGLCLLLAASLMSCGKDGVSGATGSTGATGPSGTTKITKYMSCNGTIAGLTGAAGTALNGLVIIYSVSLLNSGDVFVSGGVASSSIQIGSSSFWAAASVGATNGSIIFVDDFATPNGGFWALTGDRALATNTAVYTDSSLGAQSPVTITSSAGACTITNY